MPLLKPGVPTVMFTRFDAAGRIAGRVAITKVADAAVSAVRKNLRSAGSHAYGTPSPARPGGPPARISSTLMKSIDRSRVTREAFGFFCQIGTAQGMIPPYAMGVSPTTSSQYGLILESLGLKDGSTYPFFYDTVELVFVMTAPIIFERLYGDAFNVVRTI